MLGCHSFPLRIVAGQKGQKEAAYSLPVPMVALGTLARQEGVLNLRHPGSLGSVESGETASEPELGGKERRQAVSVHDNSLRISRANARRLQHIGKWWGKCFINSATDQASSLITSPPTMHMRCSLRMSTSSAQTPSTSLYQYLSMYRILPLPPGQQRVSLNPHHSSVKQARLRHTDQ